MGRLASPETFMAAVRASRGLDAAPSDPDRAGPTSEDMQRRPALHPGVAKRPLLSPSTVERGTTLLHAEDPAESAAILSSSDSNGNGNAGGHCDASDNSTGNGNGGNTGNGNGDSANSSKDDNAGSGDCNDMDDGGRHFSPEPLNELLNMVGTFTLELNARPKQPPGTLPASRRHTEAPPVEAPRENVPQEEARTEPHEKEPRRSGLRESKWAPRA